MTSSCNPGASSRSAGARSGYRGGMRVRHWDKCSCPDSWVNLPISSWCLLAATQRADRPALWSVLPRVYFLSWRLPVSRGSRKNALDALDASRTLKTAQCMLDHSPSRPSRLGRLSVPPQCPSTPSPSIFVARWARQCLCGPSPRSCPPHFARRNLSHPRLGIFCARARLTSAPPTPPWHSLPCSLPAILSRQERPDLCKW